MPERKFRRLVQDSRRKCIAKVPRTFQESIFQIYWSLGTYNQRILFIGSLIDISNKKTQLLQKHPEKPREAAYHVEYEDLQYFDERASFTKTVLKKKLDFLHN